MVAAGAYLDVYDTAGSVLLNRCRVFETQSIHGIAVGKSSHVDSDLHLIVWGGSSLVWLNFTQLHDVIAKADSDIADRELRVADWVLDAVVSPAKDDNSAILITAHNALIQLNVDPKSGISSLTELGSPSRSILYSAHLVWDTQESVLVAAGTVFGEIVVWQSYLRSKTPGASFKVHSTFIGHEGSIFGVNISAEVKDATGRVTRLLASCSDDRTIRIWNIQPPKELQAMTLDVSSETTLRETGFGSNNEERATDSTIVDQCLAMNWGHSSRIWRVRFHISDDCEIKVFSFGEDATCQQWILESWQNLSDIEHAHSDMSARGEKILRTSEAQSAELIRISTSAFHSGKHIWSADIWGNAYGQIVIASGGADGQVAMYTSPQHLPERSRGMSKSSIAQVKLESINNTVPYNIENDRIDRNWSIDDVFKEIALGYMLNSTASTPVTRGGNRTESTSKVVPTDAFNKYAFVGETRLLAITTSGRVLLANLAIPVSWQELFMPAESHNDLRSYSVVSALSRQGFAFLAGANGVVYMYTLDGEIRAIARVNGKVAALLPFGNGRTSTLGVLVTVLGSSHATLLTFTMGTITHLPEETSAILPARFVPTAIGFTSRHIILGSLSGSLALFTLKNLSEAVHIWTPSTSKGQQAVTDIVSISQNMNTPDTSYILATGRNGRYSIYSISNTTLSKDDTSAIIVEHVHQSAPPFGPLIEKAWFHKDVLYLCGFRSTRFVVWNETQHCEVLSVECGGAHRSNAYSHLDSGGGHFVYTKASRIYLTSHTGPSHRIIKNGGHGREIKACAVSANHQIVATGAEDTAIRLWRYSDAGGDLNHKFECLSIVEKHVTGIQHLQWLGSHYLFSSGANEEFFIWAVSDIPGFGLGVICEATFNDKSVDGDLRITSFDVTEIPTNLAPDVATSEYLISMVLSDSVIRSYIYSKDAGFFEIGHGRYTSSCLTQARHILSGHGRQLLTGSTDGHLSVFSMNGAEHNQLLTVKAHQNSIKCLDVAKHGLTDVIIASGGDDNALTITLLKDAAFSQAIIPAAHAAAINTVILLPETSEREDEHVYGLVSSGNDQRVKQWKVVVAKDRGIRVTQVADKFTSVADIADGAVLRSNASGGSATDLKIVLVGAGMDVWRIQ